MENPCYKECPRRSLTCHSFCPDYDKYRKFLKRKKALIKKSKVYDDYIGARKQETVMKKERESMRKQR